MAGIYHHHYLFPSGLAQNIVKAIKYALDNFALVKEEKLHKQVQNDIR